MCLHLGPAAGGCCGGTPLSSRKFFRSSLLGDFCSVHSQLLVLLPEERSAAQGERLSYTSSCGPSSEGRASCGEQLKHSAWLLPFTEQQTALVEFTCSQHRRTLEKPEERQKYPSLFTARFTTAEAGFRGCTTNCWLIPTLIHFFSLRIAFAVHAKPSSAVFLEVMC